MSITPEEAAAIALAFAALEISVEDRSSKLGDRSSKLDRYVSSHWGRVDNPVTWLDFARREALQLDGDV